MSSALGQGRYGLLFLAQDPDTRTTVVIRTFPRGLSVHSTAALMEALDLLCLSLLEHPAIARPLAAGVEGDLPYLAHSYLPGRSLDAVLAASGPLPLAEALVRLTPVAAAIDFAAAAGVHHGILTPADVILGPEAIGISGFGLVQALTAAGVAVDTASPYSSPQLLAGAPPSHADDIYSLAALTVACLGPSAAHDGIAGTLEAALAPEPAARPRTALDLFASLQRAAAAVPPAVIAAPPAPAAGDHLYDAPLQQPPLELPLREQHVPELPLHSPLPALDEPPYEAAVLPAAIRQMSSAGGSRYFVATLWLAVGLLTGFAGGFLTAQRDEAPVPRIVSEASAPDGDVSQPRSTATSGREFTDAPVSGLVTGAEPVVSPEPVATEPPAAAEADALPAPAPAPASPAAAPARPRAAAPAVPGTLHVFSRPAGAQVFIDGRPAGTTPLRLERLAPGDYAVRIALPGHQRWATTVRVTPGAAARVAASLER